MTLEHLNLALLSSRISCLDAMTHALAAVARNSKTATVGVWYKIDLNRTDNSILDTLYIYDKDI